MSRYCRPERRVGQRASGCEDRVERPGRAFREKRGDQEIRRSERIWNSLEIPGRCHYSRWSSVQPMDPARQLLLCDLAEQISRQEQVALLRQGKAYFSLQF